MTKKDDPPLVVGQTIEWEVFSEFPKNIKRSFVLRDGKPMFIGYFNSDQKSGVSNDKD
jgi:hypothetical protein